MKYRIYQLKLAETTRDIRFISYQTLTEKGLQPDIKNYSLLYEGEKDGEGKTAIDILNELWAQFNCPDPVNTPKHLKGIFREPEEYMPKDFKGRSLSVSDVVVLEGEALYIDSFGYKKLVGFEKEVL